MIPILKYARTPHIAGSRLQPGDEDLGIIAPEVLEAGSLVIEEKLDGSNSGISFDRDGSLVLQSRGHVLTGRYARTSVQSAEALGEPPCCGAPRYSRVVTSCMASGSTRDTPSHTINCRITFWEFDMLDKDSGEFLSTERRASLLAGSPVLSVPVLRTGLVGRIDSYVGRSRFSSTETMEGLYLKQEEEGRVVGRYKYVRPDSFKPWRFGLSLDGSANRAEYLA